MARYLTDTFPTTLISLADNSKEDPTEVKTKKKVKTLKAEIDWMVRDFTIDYAIKWCKEGDFTTILLKGQQSIDNYKNNIKDNKDLEVSPNRLSGNPIVLKSTDECLLMYEDSIGVLRWEKISYPKSIRT